jgi:LysM repeat protein
MQAALQALTLALQPGEEAQTATAIYEVKPGDSLEKIARKNKTTLKKLKELNQQLKSDQIIVGQKLQIPGE